MFQEKWHEIYFKDIDLKLSITKKADLNFFNKFYEKFFLKYNNFEDLNSNWLKNKKKQHKQYPRSLIMVMKYCHMDVVLDILSKNYITVENI